ncbi:MAG: DUF3634 family protein [Cyanobacteria bacterium J06649_4]
MAIVVVLLGLAVLAYFCRPQPTFLIVIRDHKSTLKRGHVAPRFLSACNSIVKTLDIDRGTIKGIGIHPNMKLKFSANIPSRSHQRFRNAWHMSGR